MRKLLVFQHVPFEPLGTLDGQFRQAGFRIRYVNFHRQPEARPKLRRYHGLIVLGGPMSAEHTDQYPHLAVEREAIRSAIELGLPVLGICLGAQLIARSLGARILKGVAREIGWFDVSPTELGARDPLFAHFRSTEKIFQWHADTFTLPGGIAHLAHSPGCKHQAFRFGDCVYGLQFHLEADTALIRRWLRTPQHLKELAQLREPVDPQRVLAQTQRYAGRAAALSRAVFGEFIERFYGWRRKLALPSR